MLTFRKNYFLLTIILFVIEVLIAMFVNDKFIRPYVGDFLVVILIYCFLRAFFKIPVLRAAVSVLAFAYVIEFAQYMDVLKRSGLNHIYIVRLVLGNYFEWADLAAYTLGIIAVLVFEQLRIKRETPASIL